MQNETNMMLEGKIHLWCFIRVCTLSWIYSSSSSVTPLLQTVDFGDVNFILKRNIIAD